jgi:hypothetical protein
MMKSCDEKQEIEESWSQYDTENLKNTQMH